MLRKDLEQYLLDMDYIQEQRNSFIKEYKLREGDESDTNKAKIEYKFKKELVYVIYHRFNSKVIRFKGKIKNLSLNNDNNIVGLKEIN